MSKSLSWKGTSLKINDNDYEGNRLINILKKEIEDSVQFTAYSVQLATPTCDK